MSDTILGRCPCGRKQESTGGSYQQAEYDAAGRIVYAICEHGVVVIDRRRPTPCPRELESTGVWPYVCEQGGTEGLAREEGANGGAGTR